MMTINGDEPRTLRQVGQGGGTKDYNNLTNKPTIGGVTVEGNKALTDYGLPTIPSKTSDLTNDSGYITSADIPAIPTKTSQLTNDSGFITSSDIPAVPTKTSQLTNDSGFVTASDIPAIPTKTSQLTNDSGFVNASGAAAAAPVQSVNGQTGAVTITVPTYTAGTGISIVNGVISVNYPDGDNIGYGG